MKKEYTVQIHILNEQPPPENYQLYNKVIDKLIDKAMKGGK